MVLFYSTGNVDGQSAEQLTITSTYFTFQKAVYDHKFSVPVLIDNNPVRIVYYHFYCCFLNENRLVR